MIPLPTLFVSLLLVQAEPTTAEAAVPLWLYAALGVSLAVLLVVLALFMRAQRAVQQLEREAKVLHHELVAQRAEATARINKLERALRQAIDDPEAVRQRLEDLLPSEPYTAPVTNPNHPGS